jgi:histidinol-phosphate/aromatic aminotransferase/cobyric acid decarboxylase-like protein
MICVPKSANLPEIECIEMLENIEEGYAKRFGTTPFNVSHWDSSEAFEKEMLPHLELPSLTALLPYKFSYQIAETRAILAKLGGHPDVHGGLITPSCTSSILCVLNWLKKRSKRKIVAVCPAYFSLFHASRDFGISVHRAYLRRSGSWFKLPPPNSRVWNEPGVLWLTNPVYGGGVYFSAEDIRFVDSLLSSGWTVIADECLALPQQELIRTLGHHPNFVSIYSPHKGICINGIKFSVIAFNLKHLAFMERWADIWYGGLSYSSWVAIQHFLSSNFDSYTQRFLSVIGYERKAVEQLSSKADVEMDKSAKGHFVSCYFPKLSSSLGNSRSFLQKLVNATGGSLITGNRSRLSRNVGFSFRINLTRKDPRFRPTVARIINYVNSYRN